MTETPNTPTEKQDVPRLPEAQIKELAKDMAMGKVFCDRHIHPEEHISMVGSVFMPIGLGVLSQVHGDQLGMFYEYMDKAGPRSVNGYPMFMSVKIMHRDDLEAFWAAYKTAAEKLAEI